MLSAKKHNFDCDVGLVTNLAIENIPQKFSELLKKNNIIIFQIPYDCFLFPDEYKWSLAFYKLCVLQHISQMQYDTVCYMDTDVFVQGNMDAIWEECQQHILLYDINHGLNTKNYALLCDEVQAYSGMRKLITHYGGEFFAANTEDAKLFSDKCKSIYSEMVQSEFETTKGDEFIISLAADSVRHKVKNAGAYVYRFWTGIGFRLVSTCYQNNRVIVLHLPAEKDRGMITMFDRYISKSIVPADMIVWKIFRLMRVPLFDYLKAVAKRLIRI